MKTDLHSSVAISLPDPEAVRELAELDKLVHEPARLAILTTLANCAEADFLFLQNVTGLTKGNLSAHLSKLEAGDLVLIIKDFVGRKPHTTVRLTQDGQQAIDDYWRQMKILQATLAPKEAPAAEPTEDTAQQDRQSVADGGAKSAKGTRKDTWRAW